MEKWYRFLKTLWEGVEDWSRENKSVRILFMEQMDSKAVNFGKNKLILRNQEWQKERKKTLKVENSSLKRLC